MKPYVWALLSAVVWGIAPLIEKFGLGKIPVWTGLFYRCFGVLIGLVILSVFKFKEFKDALCLSHAGWVFLVLGGLLASILGQIFFYHALKAGEASRVTPVAAIYPLFTFVLGVLLLNEKLTWAKAGGVFFVILGAMLLK